MMSTSRKTRKNVDRGDSPFPKRVKSTRSLRSRNTNKIPDVYKTPNKKIKGSSSSTFDSGIESSCDKPSSSQSSSYRTKSRLNIENVSPKLGKRSHSSGDSTIQSTSTPFAKKKQVKDSDNCFGFQELMLEDDWLLLESKTEHNSWLWSDDIDSTRDTTVPDPGLSPIKEPVDESKAQEDLDGSLFDEKFYVRSEKLASSRKSYSKANRPKRNVEQEESINMSGYFSDENANKSIKKKRKVNKKYETEAKDWEKKLNLELEEIDHFDLCVE